MLNKFSCQRQIQCRVCCRGSFLSRAGPVRAVVPGWHRCHRGCAGCSGTSSESRRRKARRGCGEVSCRPRAERTRGLFTGIPNIAGNGTYFTGNQPWAVAGRVEPLPSAGAALPMGMAAGSVSCAGDPGTAMPTAAPASPCSGQPLSLPAPAPRCWREWDAWPWGVPPWGRARRLQPQTLWKHEGAIPLSPACPSLSPLPVCGTGGLRARPPHVALGPWPSRGSQLTPSSRPSS